jgi:hypothetical protein
VRTVPDDQSPFGQTSTAESLKEILPPVLMAVGALSLLRMSRFLSLVAVGALLYDAAVNSDADRQTRGRDLASRRRASRLLDREIEDSFPASDPPSFSGTTAGAPETR